MNNSITRLSLNDPVKIGYKRQGNDKPSERLNVLSLVTSTFTPNQDCERGGPVLCSRLLTVISLLLILVTLPLSLLLVVKVVQEFERAVIFRLGRLVRGGARGPGVFFIVPCVDR